MSELDAIVNAYDIRGRAPEQLDEVTAHALASAFADVVVRTGGGSRAVVGHDMRTTSPELATAVVEGLTARGVDVVELGLCSTDELYYACGAGDVPGVMVTASHHPSGWNGLKLCRAGATPVDEGSGLPDVVALAERFLHDEVPHWSGAMGSIESRDVLVDYARFLRDLVDLSGIRPLVVAVDAGNGMAGLTVPAVLGADAGLPPLPIRLFEVHMRLDGRLPHRGGGPLEAESVADLQAAVREHHADLGLAFDADADRCLVVDENGVAVSPSAITALIGLREVEREQRAGRDATVICNLITSRVVPDLMTAAGARTVRTRVGHSYVKREMAAAGAVFGGEHSGHYYFRDFFSADDGLLAALHVLAALGEQPLPMSVLADLYQPYHASGEINLVVPEVASARERVLRAYTGAYGGGVEVDELDGLTVSHWDAVPQWWFNLRESQTEPVLRLNVEAADEDIMEKLRDDVIALVEGR